MSKQLHVIYREESISDGRSAWYSYSYPESISAGGHTLEDLRDQFREAMLFAYEDAPEPEIREHIEQRAADGLFLRIAVDRHSLDRDYVSATLRTGLAQPAGYRPEISDRYLATTGDVVVICCVATDLMSWVFEQMGDRDAVHVAMAVSEFGVAHTVLAGPAATDALDDVQTVADLGLSGGSTVGQFITAMVANTPSGSSNRPVLVSTA